MGKIEPIGQDIDWSIEAAVASAMESVKDYPDAQVVIMYRLAKGKYANYRAANVTNAQLAFMADEIKHTIMNRCHDCKCEEG